MDLGQTAFFGNLSPEALERVRRVAELRPFPTGSVICRKGEEGRAFYVVASGGVAVEIGGSSDGPSDSVYLGPGEVFGEMSILAGLPVSATIVAARRTSVYVIGSEAFLALLESEPQLQLALSRMLIGRIRERTSSRARGRRPGCAILALANGSTDLHRLASGVFRGVRHYAPGSLLLDATAGSKGTGGTHAGADAPPPFFPSCDDSPRVWGGGPDTWHASVTPSENGSWYEGLIRNWRARASWGQYLVVVAECSDAAPLYPLLERGDVAVTLEDRDKGSTAGGAPVHAGPADHGIVSIGSDADPSDDLWRFRVPRAEPETPSRPDAWHRENLPKLDWVARWITRREIGVALGAGAARGFAHLGVLEVIEDAGIPIDTLSGSSMGGIVAVVYARTGNAREAIELTRECIGGNSKVRDVSWLPRSSFLVGAKVKQAAFLAGGGFSFAQLQRPAAVAAADLALGRRVVLNRGPVEGALLATSAIPGVFPAVIQGGSFMVDGALVSRIPVDLLLRRRCGLKIAVNVIPSPEEGLDDSGIRAEQLRSRAAKLFGFREIIARSWELLGWWHGAADAALADILLEPLTSRYSGYDFDRFDEMIDAGREAANRKLPELRAAAATVLRGGTG